MKLIRLMSQIEGETGFHLSFDLEEDIAAELEDFALLVRLGIKDEAQHFLDNVLYNHLDHFAVVAEIVQFLVDGEFPLLVSRLDDLLNELKVRKITFDDPLEQSFIDTVTSLSQNSLRTQLESPIAAKDLQKLESLDFDGSLDYTIQLQIQELCFLASSYSQRLSSLFIPEAVEYLRVLMKSNHAWEAVRQFGIICEFVSRRPGAITASYMLSIYLEISRWIDENDGATRDRSRGEETDQKICALWMRYRWLRCMDGARFEDPNGSKSQAYKAMIGAIMQLFALLPDPEPRGSLVEYFWKSKRDYEMYTIRHDLRARYAVEATKPDEISVNSHAFPSSRPEASPDTSFGSAKKSVTANYWQCCQCNWENEWELHRFCTDCEHRKDARCKAIYKPDTSK